MAKLTDARPPAGLRPATRRWFQHVTQMWQLEQHHIRVLSVACRAWDEVEAATDDIKRAGLTITQPSGAKRPNPSVRIRNEASALFLRSLRELDLDLEPPAASSRPPALRSIVGSRKVS